LTRKTRSFGHGPVHRMLGLELLEHSPEAARIRLPVRAEFAQEEGVVQGGILAALADATAVYLLLDGLPEDRSLTSIEFKLNFLSAARLDAGPLEARATIIRRGGQIALCRSVIEQAGNLVAEGLFTYLFVEK